MINPITFDFDTLQTLEKGKVEVNETGSGINYGFLLLGIVALGLGLKLVFEVTKNYSATTNGVPEKT